MPTVLSTTRPSQRLCLCLQIHLRLHLRLQLRPCSFQQPSLLPRQLPSYLDRPSTSQLLRKANLHRYLGLQFIRSQPGTLRPRQVFCQQPTANSLRFLTWHRQVRPQAQGTQALREPGTEASLSRGTRIQGPPLRQIERGKRLVEISRSSKEGRS